MGRRNELTDDRRYDDTGRLGYRGPDEPRDGPGDTRLVLRCSQFWRDETERLTYEHAVEANPRMVTEGAITYMQRIASLATGKLAGAAVKAMPEARLPYREDE